MPEASVAMDQARPPLVGLAACKVEAVLTLNSVNSVETSVLDAVSYGELLKASGFAMAFGGEPQAFMIAFNDASDHRNANLAWFRERHDRFYYVDRVVVAHQARGQGLARALYGELFARARAEDRPVIGCEINVIPANPASDALHSALGFSEIALRHLPGGKAIRYMRLDLP